MDISIYNEKKIKSDLYSSKDKIKKIKKFELTGNIWAYCYKVIDGDSIKVCFYIQDELYKYSFRLAGIDTPELRSKNLKEKEFAKKVKKYLKLMIETKFIYLKLQKFDKYGRILADVYYNDELINELLVTKGYAHTYSGGTKQKWFD